MKTYFKVFAFFFSVAILAACTAAENPVLAEASKMAASLTAGKGSLDSTIQAKIASISEAWGKMTADTANMPDSTTTAAWEGKLAALKAAQEKLAAWTAPTVPSAEELGEQKPEDILNSVKEAQTAFDAVKGEVDAIN
jgi:hypothetical protein